MLWKQSQPSSGTEQKWWNENMILWNVGSCYDGKSIRLENWTRKKIIKLSTNEFIIICVCVSFVRLTSSRCFYSMMRSDCATATRAARKLMQWGHVRSHVNNTKRIESDLMLFRGVWKTMENTLYNTTAMAMERCRYKWKSRIRTWHT